jgi:hypothetical protein
MLLPITQILRTAPLPAASDTADYLPETGQVSDVDIDQVARNVPYLPLHRQIGIQIAQVTEPQTAESPGDGGEGWKQQPGNMAQMQPMATEIQVVMHLPQIQHPQLSAAHAASIRRRDSWT